jgi:hypothetical protein
MGHSAEPPVLIGDETKAKAIMESDATKPQLADFAAKALKKVEAG